MGHQHYSPAKQNSLEGLYQITDKKNARSAGFFHHIQETRLSSCGGFSLRLLDTTFDFYSFVCQLSILG
jgi:hypothetical protein